jgi:hypothetical protein
MVAGCSLFHTYFPSKIRTAGWTAEKKVQSKDKNIPRPGGTSPLDRRLASPGRRGRGHMTLWPHPMFQPQFHSKLYIVSYNKESALPPHDSTIELKIRHTFRNLCGQNGMDMCDESTLARSLKRRAPTNDKRCSTWFQPLNVCPANLPHF